MSWLITVLLMLATLAALLPVLLLLLAVLDPPRTEEGWRRELASTGGFEHIIIADAYRIHHGKGAKDGRKKDKKGSASRRGLAVCQGLYASRSSSTGAADLRVRGDKQILCNDGDNHQLSRRAHARASDRAVQDAPQGAGSEASAPSPRPADKYRENRPSEPTSTSQSFALQAGSGGREGSLIDAYDSPFWKKLVKHGEELGL